MVHLRKKYLALKGLKQSVFHLGKNIGTERVKTIYVSFNKEILALKGLKQSVSFKKKYLLLALKGLKQSMLHLKRKYWH